MMFNQSTVIVVGAGASKEANLPTGAELALTIAQMLDFKFERHSVERGDNLIASTLIGEAHRQKADPNDYIRAARHISQAMPQSFSIDNFIDSHAANKLIALVGKIAIVRSILEAEQRSALFIDQRNSYNRLDFRGLSKTWFNKFVQLLSEHCQVEQLPERLSRIAFVIFNYDRCVEHFLFHSLQNVYNVKPEDAARLVNSMTIFHPYGTVGSLPWQDKGGDTIPFGNADLNESMLKSLAGSIKTFTEGTDPTSSHIDAIRSLTKVSSMLIFLGFSFHHRNVELLMPVEDAPNLTPTSLYATAKGMSQSDVAALLDELKHLRRKLNAIEVRPDLTCSELFMEYRRRLALSSS